MGRNYPFTLLVSFRSNFKRNCCKDTLYFGCAIFFSKTDKIPALVAFCKGCIKNYCFSFIQGFSHAFVGLFPYLAHSRLVDCVS